MREMCMAERRENEERFRLTDESRKCTPPACAVAARAGGVLATTFLLLALVRLVQETEELDHIPLDDQTHLGHLASFHDQLNTIVAFAHAAESLLGKGCRVGLL